MISIGKLSADQGHYYLNQAGEPTTATNAVTSGAEEYYVGGPEASGEWLGTGAAALKVSGAVTGEALTALLAGIDPSTGESLRRCGYFGRGVRRHFLCAERA